MKKFNRIIQPLIMDSLKNYPAVFLNGPRQSGKSTLAHEVLKQLGGEYVSFDDLSILSAAQSDPKGFLSQFRRFTVIDEVQLVPSLFRALKLFIDEKRHQHPTDANGCFLLTGSANILALPQLSDALVGRVDIVTLFPLSSCEILGLNANFINAILSTQTNFKMEPACQMNLVDIIEQATFPQIASDPNLNRLRWFDNYFSTLLQRDVRSLAEIEKIDLLPKMLRSFAARAGGLLNDASMASDLGINTMTFRRYRSLLEGVFLLNTIPPWYSNIGKRLVKSPKVYLNDTLGLCNLIGVDVKEIQNQQSELLGKIVENFVASELLKQLSFAHQGTLFHFRTYNNQEIDFIIEKPNGTLIAIEVKARQTVTQNDFQTMRMLQNELPTKFSRGIVLYQGDKILPFGHNLWAMPLSSLWSLKNEANSNVNP